MAIQIQGNAGVVADVSGTTFRSMKTQPMPYDFATVGHYRTSVTITSTSAQAANSRLFEVRNTGSNLLVLTQLRLQAIQGASGTAQINRLECFKLTGFSAVDTTNTVTPVSSVKRTGNMTAYPGNAAVRHLTLAGNVNGMTGGTLTKDTQAFGAMVTPVTTSAQTVTYILDLSDINQGSHPFVFANNEGWDVESAVLNVTTFGYTWTIDCSWCEVTAF